MLVWKASEGKMHEARLRNGDVVRVDPPIPLETVERCAKQFTDAQMDNFLGLRALLKGKLDTDQLEDYVSVQQFLNKLSGMESVHRIARPQPTVAELPKPEGPPRQIPQNMAESSYKTPDKIGDVQMHGKRTSYRWVPRALVDTVWATLESKGTITRQTMEDLPGWSYSYGALNAALTVLIERKLLQQPIRGSYQVADPPMQDIKDVCARRGMDITPGTLREHFWVPEDVAKKWLVSLEGSFLKKHPVKESWSILNMPPVGPEKREREERNGQIVLPARVPVLNEFVFEKRDIICQDCGHNYGHAYVAGQLAVCQHCYMKRGGTTSHGKDATIGKR